jgi:Ca2+-transporting ATPase
VSRARRGESPSPAALPPEHVADGTPFPIAPAQQVARALASGTSGLDEAAVSAIRKRYGSNRFERARRRGWRVLVSQFNDVLVYILLVALAISLAVPLLETPSGPGHPTGPARFADAIIIAAILVLNALLGFVQEFRAERAIAELERLGPTIARVRRSGHERTIPTADVVIGDRVLVNAGDRVCADGRLIHAAFLRVDESSLTGESLPVAKDAEPAGTETPGAAPPLSDQTSMVFAGTLVTRGSAEFVITATGSRSQTGRIAALVGATEIPTTPMQRRLQRLGRMLGAVALGLCLVVLAVGLARDQPFLDMALVAVSLAVSAVPEGLPAIVTVCFAFGVRRMAKRRALVRRLSALETLGGVTVVCSDKTGTMTTNRMTVVEHRVAEDTTALAEAMVSCNHARLPELGDPTELALLEWGRHLGALRREIVEEEVPFTSAAKYMQTRHHTDDGREVRFVKGAVERVAMLCVLPPDASLLEEAERLAARGLRVLGAATDEGDGLRFAGFVGMEDPPREGVAQAVAEARTAGIRTVMITGDHGTTAAAIGRRVGVEGRLVLGPEIEAMDDAALRQVVRDAAVFARVSPEHKVRICDAMIHEGEIVAMSGDGVNDAPALRRAHVGVAMGGRGTEVAREAADIVLSDDHYATIIAAIAEGRRITDNIRRFVLFLLRANFDELHLILTTVALSLPVPYLPIHILWINLMTDGLPALALGTERAEPDVMRRPPRPAGEHLLSGQWRMLAFATLFGFAVVLGFFLWRLDRGDSLEMARSGALTLAIAFELVQAMSARSRHPIWRIGVLSNRWMLGAIATVVGLHAVLLYTPLAGFFRLVPLPGSEVAAIVGFAFLALLVFESIKLIRPRA